VSAGGGTLWRDRRSLRIDALAETSFGVISATPARLRDLRQARAGGGVAPGRQCGDGRSFAKLSAALRSIAAPRQSVGRLVDPVTPCERQKDVDAAGYEVDSAEPHNPL
jgi:hypothetical protein